MIHKERIKNLNEFKSMDTTHGDYILYWMQASVRAHWNHALEYAIETANKMQKPLLTVFGLTSDFPEANSRHYRFLIEGLLHVKNELEKRGVAFSIQLDKPPSTVLKYSDDASLVITDKGYLEIQKRWYDELKKYINCPLIQVESNVIVPVEIASNKEEYSAGTFRPKITRKLKYFMKPVYPRTLKVNSLDIDIESADPDPDKLMKKLGVKDEMTPSIFQGGTKEAIKLFEKFLSEKLECFEKFRNDPVRNCLSNMSPYLHFGQISPLYLAYKASKAGRCTRFLEELIVRRELSMNFVCYNKNYYKINSLPKWAYNTLMEHASDPREYEYGLKEFEKGETHDKYWNAAQKEMVLTGKMHGYMRMYWGKKILEWTEHPEKAYEIALHLNNKFEIDGRDPNGFAGVAWCFGKHDRAWGERRIFGKVRYMNDRGLERKFKIQEYVNRIETIETQQL